MKNHLHLFEGKSILVVEGEYFLADDARRALIRLKAQVVGPAATVDGVFELIETCKLDGAILDIHLGDELVFPVADKLEELHIPFVFASGYDPRLMPARFAGFILCEKPAELEKIAYALFSADHRSGLH